MNIMKRRFDFVLHTTFIIMGNGVVYVVRDQIRSDQIRSDQRRRTGLKNSRSQDLQTKYKLILLLPSRLTIDHETRLQDDERKALVGYQPGAYVRVKLSNVPCEFVRHFDPRRVHLIGGLTPQEENFGFVQVQT